MKTEKNSVDEQLRKYINSHYQEWDVPSKSTLIPIRGIIKRIPKEGEFYKESDFTNFVSSNFHINKEFKITGNINTFKKTNMMKLEGEIKLETTPEGNKYPVEIDLIEPTTDPESPILKHKFTGKIEAEDMGYTAPYLIGKFTNATNLTQSYEMKFSFEDLSGYRFYSSNEQVSGNVVYINPRYMYYHLFGFAVFNGEPLIVNGKQLMAKEGPTKTDVEFYQVEVAYHPDLKKKKPILAVVRKFVKPYKAFHLAGRKLCPDTGDLSELEFFSADPNEQRWVSKRYKMMEPFYNAAGIKVKTDPNMGEKMGNGDFDEVALRMIKKVREEGFLVSREDFIEILKVMEDRGQVEFLMKRIGGFVVNLKAEDVEMYGLNDEVKTALYNYAALD